MRLIKVIKAHWTHLGPLDQYVPHSPRKSLCAGILETFGCHQYNYVGSAHSPSVFLLEGRIDGACWQSQCFSYHCNGKKGGDKAGKDAGGGLLELKVI